MSEWYQIVDKARSLIDEIDAKLNREKKTPKGCEHPERDRVLKKGGWYCGLCDYSFLKPSTPNQVFDKKKMEWVCELCGKNMLGCRCSEKECGCKSGIRGKDCYDYHPKPTLAERLWKSAEPYSDEKPDYDDIADEAKKAFEALVEEVFDKGHIHAPLIKDELIERIKAL